MRSGRDSNYDLRGGRRELLLGHHGPRLCGKAFNKELQDHNIKAISAYKATHAGFKNSG